MDVFPIKTFIAYMIIWGTWLVSHDALLIHQDYLVKLDSLIYNNCTSTTEFPYGPREFAQFNMA